MHYLPSLRWKRQLKCIEFMGFRESLGMLVVNSIFNLIPEVD
jgi:hypothetical protein